MQYVFSRFLTILFAIVLSLHVAYKPVVAQQIPVKGKIIDSRTGEPLSGARIVVSGTKTGTVANAKGEFLLELPADAESIAISYTGYAAQMVKISDLPENRRLILSLAPTGFALSEIVVNGLENKRKMTEIAGSIAVVQTQEIQRYDNTSLQNVLNAIPGVRMESSMPGGSTRLSIRGSLLRSPFGIRGVKGYWNDVPLSDAGNNMPYDVLEPTILGSMEVIKGPVGSIYGAGTGGVILFSSALPQYGERSVEASYSAGSFGLQRFGVSAKFANEIGAFNIGYVDQTYGGYRPNGGSYRRVLNVTGQIHTGDKGTLSLFAYNAQRRFDIPGPLTKAELDANPFQSLPFAVTAQTRLVSDASNIGASYNYAFTDNLSATAAVYVNHSATPEHPTGNTAAAGSYFKGQNVSMGGRGKIVWTPTLGDVKARIIAGGEYQRDRAWSQSFRVNAQGELQPNQLTDYNEVQTTQNIFFAQAEVDLPLEFILTAGLSLNSLTYNVSDLLRTGAANQSAVLSTPNAFAPRVALVKKITPSISAHASLSRGFSPPTRGEISSAGVLNLGLRPEDGTNIEAGVRGSAFDNRLNFDVTGYIFTLTNIIISRRNAADQNIFENAGGARQNGVESTLSYTLTDENDPVFNLSRVWVNYAFQDYKFSDYVIRNDRAGTEQNFSGNRLPGVSPHTITGGIDVALKMGFYGNITVFYFDRRFITNANDVSEAGYNLINGKVGYKQRFGDFTVDVNGGFENMANSLYSSNLRINGFGGRFFDPGAPRNFFGGVSLRWHF
jgi:iron complex outermembrane receptor protein